MKSRTNEQILRKLLRELHPIEVAVLRERISKICEITLSQVDKWKPMSTFPIDRPTYKKIIEHIDEIVGFQKEVKGIPQTASRSNSSEL
jgi:hypothetical protein